MKKDIDAGNVKVNGKKLPFQTKFEQAVEMLPEISDAFRGSPVLVVTDSWFGNDGLFKPMRHVVGQHCHILSRLHINASLFYSAPKPCKKQRGRTKK